ncbi:MAG: hypothetical protein J5I90_18385 [Caldilineales bacterium]|nr:hypothetical protein [Caldilineales bacterium]
MSMDDLFNSILGGAGGSGGEGQADDALGDMLGGLMGGDSGAAGGMGGLLGGLMGGGQSGGGMLDGILGSLLGGGAGGGQNAFLMPIADAISKKVGIPREIALVAVSFLLTKLLSGMAGKRGGSLEEADLSEITRLAEADTRTQAAFLLDAGLTQELAERTGLDEETAERTLEEALRMVGGQIQGMQNAPDPGQLPDAPPSNLLDSW